MKNKIVASMLIFLSVVATTLGAVSLTSDTVLAGGNINGGGSGSSGTGSGGNASGLEISKYRSNDCGYRIFLVPSRDHMTYLKILYGVISSTKKTG